MPGGHGDVPGVRLWERGEKQMLTLATPDIRRHICELIPRAKNEDEVAYDCLVRQLHL